MRSTVHNTTGIEVGPNLRFCFGADLCSLLDLTVMDYPGWGRFFRSNFPTEWLLCYLEWVNELQFIFQFNREYPLHDNISSSVIVFLIWLFNLYVLRVDINVLITWRGRHIIRVRQFSCFALGEYDEVEMRDDWGENSWTLSWMIYQISFTVLHILWHFRCVRFRYHYRTWHKFSVFLIAPVKQ